MYNDEKAQISANRAATALGILCHHHSGIGFCGIGTDWRSILRPKLARQRRVLACCTFLGPAVGRGCRRSIIQEELDFGSWNEDLHFFPQYTFHCWRQMRKTLHKSILILLLSAAPSVAQSLYFPPGSFDDSSRVGPSLSDPYSKYLRALDEPSLVVAFKN